MPHWDFTCPRCATTVDRWFVSLREAEASTPTCTTCGGPLVREVPAPGFHVQGFNAKNGYTRRDG